MSSMVHSELGPNIIFASLVARCRPSMPDTLVGDENKASSARIPRSSILRCGTQKAASAEKVMHQSTDIHAPSDPTSK